MKTAQQTVEQVRKPEDYKSSLKPVWCPGCGDYGVLNAICQAFSQLQIQPEKTMVISGIGCSSRIPGYLRSYGFNSVHGRALPIAVGAKLADPEITVLAAGGDGDGFSIGIGHFPHLCRRNVDITYVVMDNSIYGLTKGQLSPTSPLEVITTTSRYGNVEQPINPVSLALGCEASFVARGFSGDVKHLTQIIIKGIQHPGFAFIQVISPCVTYQGMGQFMVIKNKLHYLEDDPSYDPNDLVNAFRVANEVDRVSVGVIHSFRRPTYHENVTFLRQKAKQAHPEKLEELIQRFRP